MKAVIYARVSSKEQEESGYSLPAQEKFLKEYAAKNGFDVIKVFTVSESAGGKIRRIIFNEMMGYIRKYGISIVIVETTDRLTRNFTDVPTIDTWIMENDSNQIHLVKEGCVLHKDSRSHEWFMWRVKVATAEYYVKLLSENVRKGQREKLAQGWLPTTSPLGYKTMGDKRHKIHVIDEQKALLVRKIFELYSTGNYSLTVLAKIVNEEGLRNKRNKKVSRSKIYDLLSDPFYYGKNRWNGKISNGQHKPLISKELFEAVQVQLTRKINQPQFKKLLPVFKAKIKCEECGGTITWEIQKGHWYGHCNHYKNCSQKAYVRQEKVEEQLFPYFDKVAPKNEKVLHWLEKALKEGQAAETDYNTFRREEISRLIKLADERMEKAYADKLDGKIPAALCEKVIKNSAKEKEDLLESLAKLGEVRIAYYEAGFAIHELALKAKDIYKCRAATAEEKRLLLSHIFSNLALNADKITPNYTLAFEFLVKWMPKVNRSFELAENRMNKGEKDAFASFRSTVCGWLDSFRTYDWVKAIPCPEESIAQIRQLLSIV